MTRIDALAIIGLAVAFAGGLALWWQVAIIILGAVLFSTAIGLALLRRKGVAGTEHRER